MSPLALPLSIDDLELAFFKEQYAEGYGKQTGKVILRRNGAKSPKPVYSGTPTVAPTGYNAGGQNNTTWGAGQDGAVKVSATNTGASYAIVSVSSTPIVKSSTTYTVSCEVYVPTGSSNPILQVFNGGINSVSPAISTKDVWTKVSLTVTSASNVAAGQYLGVGISVSGTSVAGDNFSVRNLLIEEGVNTAGVYFDGDTTDLNGITYEWEGAAGNSTSIKWSTDPIAAENLFYNYRGTPSTTQTPDGFLPKSVNVNANSTAWSKGNGVIGFKASVLGNTGNNRLTFYHDPFVNGMMYTIECKVRKVSGDDASRLSLGYDTWGAPVPGSTPVGAGIPAGHSNWLQFRFQTTISSILNTGFRIFFMPEQGAIPATEWEIKDFVMVLGDWSTGASFGGLTDPDIFWTGPQDASTAIRKSVSARNIDFLEREYYAKGSGLTPKEQYSVADHMLAYLRNNFKAVAGGPTTVVATNLVRNSRCDSATDWYMSNPGPSGVVSVGYDAALTAAYTEVTTAALDPQHTFRYGGQFSTTTTVPVNDSKIYYQRLEVMSTVNDNRNFAIDWYDASGSSLGSSTTSSLPDLVANQWQTVELTATPPAGAKFASVCILYRTASSIIRPVGSRLNVRKALFGPLASGQTSIAYFDPNTDNNSRWTGMAGNSVSEKVDPSKHGITDLLMSYRINKSNLPVKRSSADHELSLYKIALGLNPAWDDFNRADGAAGNAASGQSWVSWLTAGWAITNNTLRWTGASDGALVINSGYSDKYSIAFSVLEVNGNFPIGFIVRGTASNDYMKIYHRSTQKDWNLQYNGGAIITISGNGSVQSGDYLKCVVNGTDISIYVNDALQGTFTGITSVPTGTYQGVIGSGGLATTIDKFMIEKL